jgi:hypothetical protein
MTDEEIEKEMLRRLKERRKVTVYARGEFLIDRVLGICNKFIITNDKYAIIRVNEYLLGENRSVSIEITEEKFFR